MLEYFNTIYIKNVDIWGFVSVYTALFDKLSKVSSPNEHHSKIINHLKNIYETFLYKTSISIINIDELIVELRKLNKIFLNIDTNNEIMNEKIKIIMNK